MSKKTDYQSMKQIFLDMRKAIFDIMKDIVDAIEIGDIVLLNDAVAYGLMDYMGLFIEVKEE